MEEIMKTLTKQFKLRALTFIVLIHFSMFFSCLMQGQNNNKNFKAYEVWVTKTNHLTEKGYLYYADLNGLKIMSKSYKDSSSFTFISAEEIKSIKLRKKRKVIGHAIVGGLTGAGIGVLIGLADAENSEGISVIDKGTIPLVSGAFMGAIGAYLGIVIAKAKRKIMINGDINVYHENFKALDRFTIKNLKKNDDKN